MMAGEKLPIARIADTHYTREVYEPSDDSFAIVDAVIADISDIQALNPTLCLEVGSGSGYVTCSVATAMAAAGLRAEFITTDINPDACACTTTTMRAHAITAFDTALADLAAPLSRRLRGAVDLLLFNPPYVLTPSEEVGRPGMCAAWAGGFNGREVIDRFLPAVPHLLSPGGRCYMVTVAENRPEELVGIAEAAGLDAEVALVRSADEEKLHILRMVKRVA
ncbi:unnamed protein product [Pedinophyceae sp. YPF-701]|nr:unnamed protein product [Pedinophyceae sp. YPF-701]